MRHAMHDGPLTARRNSAMTRSDMRRYVLCLAGEGLGRRLGFLGRLRLLRRRGPRSLGLEQRRLPLPGALLQVSEFADVEVHLSAKTTPRPSKKCASASTRGALHAKCAADPLRAALSGCVVLRDAPGRKGRVLTASVWRIAFVCFTAAFARPAEELLSRLLGSETCRDPPSCQTHPASPQLVQPLQGLCRESFSRTQSCRWGFHVPHG